MKRQYLTTVNGFLLSSCLVLGQPVRPPGPGAILAGQPQGQPQAVEYVSFTRFDLDFPGGTPDQLVRDIEKASGKPLNAIIQNEFVNLQLPPLRMRKVTVSQLFSALTQASTKTVPYVTGFYDYAPGSGIGRRNQIEQYQTSFGFRTDGSPVKEDSVWYFFYNKRPALEEPKACRFYQLEPYLKTFKVEDITTAIQTGWKMLGEASPPTISYHKDTRLLIAVGEPSKLQMIDDVLQQLSGKDKPAAANPVATKSKEAAKPSQAE